jgi:hypothetical protein
MDDDESLALFQQQHDEAQQLHLVRDVLARFEAEERDRQLPSFWEGDAKTLINDLREQQLNFALAQAQRFGSIGSLFDDVAHFQQSGSTSQAFQATSDAFRARNEIVYANASEVEALGNSLYARARRASIGVGARACVCVCVCVCVRALTRGRAAGRSAPTRCGVRARTTARTTARRRRVLPVLPRRARQRRRPVRALRRRRPSRPSSWAVARVRAREAQRPACTPRRRRRPA